MDISRSFSSKTAAFGATSAFSDGGAALTGGELKALAGADGKLTVGDLIGAGFAKEDAQRIYNDTRVSRNAKGAAQFSTVAIAFQPGRSLAEQVIDAGGDGAQALTATELKAIGGKDGLTVKDLVKAGFLPEAARQLWNAVKVVNGKYQTVPASVVAKAEAPFQAVLKGLPAADQAALWQVRRSGTLGLTDRHGVSVMTHLQQLSVNMLQMPDKVAASGFPYKYPGVQATPYTGTAAKYRQEVTGALIRHLANPATISQGNFGTCAPTTCQLVMAIQRPGDYVAMVSSLMRTGKAELANGKELKLDPEALLHFRRQDPKSKQWVERENRDWVSMAVQGAFMESYSPDAGRYSKVTENHWDAGNSVESFVASILGEGAGEKRGMTRQNRSALLGAIANSPVTLKSTSAGPQGMTDLQSEMARQKKKGLPVAVPISLNYASGELKPGGKATAKLDDGKNRHVESHSVVAVGIEGGRILIRNPQGSNFDWAQRRWPVQTDEQGRRFVERPAGGHHIPGLRYYADGTEGIPETHFRKGGLFAVTVTK